MADLNTTPVSLGYFAETCLQPLTKRFEVLYILAKSSFATSEAVLDYPQKLNVRVALQVLQQLKTYDLRKYWENVKHKDLAIALEN